MRNFQEKNYGTLNFFSERLDSLIKQQFGGKWTRLAKKAKIPLGTFDRYVKGTGKPSFDQIIRICEATGVQSDWLLMGKEETAQVEPAALYVREGVIDIAPYLNHKGEESGDGKEGNEPVNILLTANSSAFLIHSIEADPADLSIRFVSSDSMFPALSNGDAVILDASCATIPTHGIYGIMVDGKERPQFCRLQRLPDDLVKVGFDNKSYDPFTFNFSRTDVVVLGLARWVLKFL